MSDSNLFAAPSRLRRLQVEITTGCNLRCTGCQRTIGMNQGTWHNSHMPLPRFEAVLRHAPPADAVILQGIGEPTLHPKLPDMVGMARATGKFGVVSFNTNALARELAYYDHLRQAGLGHISISVDSLNSDTAEALRAGTDCDRLRAAIPALIRLFQGAVTLSVVLSRRNLAELPALLEQLHGVGGRTVEVQPLVSYAAATDPMALDADELQQAASIIEAIRRRQPEMVVLAAPALTPDGSRCRRPFRAAYVTVEGFLTPCCLTNDPALFGRTSLAKMPFAQAWQSSGVTRFMASYLDREPEICRGCAFNPSGEARPAPAPANRADATETLLTRAMQHQSDGDPAQAEAGFRAVLGTTKAGEALHHLGIARLQQGDPQAALVLLRAAEVFAPGPRLSHNLAAALTQLGQTDEARARQQRNIADHPHYAPSYRALSTLLEAAGDRNGAAGVELLLADRALNADQDALLAPAVARAAALDPGHQALLQVANRLRITGRQEHALSLLQARIAHDPGDLGARLSQAMARLAVVHGSVAEIEARRATYAAELAELDRRMGEASPAALTKASAQVGTAKPFFLAYQGEDDRALQQTYGGIVSRMMALHAPPPLHRVATGRIRVGFATAYCHLHSISKLFSGWIRELDRTQFEVILYHLGEAEDAVSADLASHCGRFHRGPRDDAAWARLIAEDGLDVLIYPEIGMHPTAVRLACRRLAPVQCVAWGHPVTTGLPAIDYFLTSDLMEPADGEFHYTETLVRLPNLSVHYDPTDNHDDGTGRDSAAIDMRRRFGMAPDTVVYICCQSLFKYHPRHDWLLPVIAARVPEARFLFIGDLAREPNARRFHERLTAAFHAAGTDPKRHLCFVPPVPTDAFPSLLRAGDVYLDSIGWSGGNTTLEAVACGLPIVTLPGRQMRGRHSAAILLMMGAEDLIAQSEKDYVDMAVNLAAQPAREAAQSVIRAGRHRLYRDEAPVRALEQFLRDVVRATTSDSADTPAGGIGDTCSAMGLPYLPNHDPAKPDSEYAFAHSN